MQKKYVFAALANFIPVLCGCLFFRGGAPLLWPLFIILQIILTCINYGVADRKSDVLFLSSQLLISTIIANWLSTRLYYTLISPDGETLIVGYAGGEVGIIFVLVLSLISLVVKAVTGRKKDK